MKVKLACALALVAVTAFAVPASAFSWNGYHGPVKIHLTNYDVGVLYNAADGIYTGAGTLNGLPQFPAPGAAPGEDSWGILQVDQILTDPAIGPKVVLFDKDTAATEITAIFYGGVDVYLNTQAGGFQQNIHANGVKLAFFEGAKNFTNIAGPTGRGTPNPVYPTVTDGSLLWTMVSVPGFEFLFPNDEFFTEFTPAGSPNGVTASGGFFATLAPVPFWGLGPQNNDWKDNPTGNALFPHDVTIAFTGDGDVGTNPNPNAPWWLVHSSDPIKGVSAVPLPSSVYMGFAGLVALAFGAYRRNKAA